MKLFVIQQTNSDIFEIIPEVAYSDDYDTVVDDAKKEQKENARPKIKNKIENIDDYETIYVGYPKLVGRYAYDSLYILWRLWFI